MAAQNEKLEWEISFEPQRSTPLFTFYHFVFFFARSLSLSQSAALGYLLQLLILTSSTSPGPQMATPKILHYGFPFLHYFIIFIFLINLLPLLLNFWQTNLFSSLLPLSLSSRLVRLMEHSMNSYMQHNPVACKPTSDNSPVEEESGWTAYFEDFSSNNNRENSYCSSFCSPSLVSDAASCAAWKLSEKNHLPDCSSIPKKLKFKKTRTEQIWFDDSLEDTASSPVNSPKVRFKTKLSYFFLCFVYFLNPAINFSILTNIGQWFETDWHEPQEDWWPYV